MAQVRNASPCCCCPLNSKWQHRNDGRFKDGFLSAQLLVRARGGTEHMDTRLFTGRVEDDMDELYAGSYLISVRGFCEKGKFLFLGLLFSFISSFYLKIDEPKRNLRYSIIVGSNEPLLDENADVPFFGAEPMPREDNEDDELSAYRRAEEYLARKAEEKKAQQQRASFPVVADPQAKVEFLLAQERHRQRQEELHAAASKAQEKKAQQTRASLPVVADPQAELLLARQRHRQRQEELHVATTKAQVKAPQQRDREEKRPMREEKRETQANELELYQAQQREKRLQEASLYQQQRRTRLKRAAIIGALICVVVVAIFLRKYLQDWWRPQSFQLPPHWAPDL